MQSLQTMINLLESNRNLHISVSEFCDISNIQNLQLEFSNIIHSKEFCNLAKSTQKGVKYCLNCKKYANRKAVLQKNPFDGYCIYGLYEVAYPVLVNDRVIGVVYVGNAVTDESKTLNLMNKACRRTGANAELMKNELLNCEHLKDPNELYQIADIVGNYLKYLYENSPKIKSNEHWTVSLMKRYAEKFYHKPISLTELSITYQKSEKYIGRLFKKEVGMSFHQYCNYLRLKESEQLLKCSDYKVIDIAIICGFNNISYFNRLFQKEYKMSPKEYRKKHKVTRK